MAATIFGRFDADDVSDSCDSVDGDRAVYMVTGSIWVSVCGSVY